MESHSERLRALAARLRELVVENDCDGVFHVDRLSIIAAKRLAAVEREGLLRLVPVGNFFPDDCPTSDDSHWLAAWRAFSIVAGLAGVHSAGLTVGSARTVEKQEIEVGQAAERVTQKILALEDRDWRERAKDYFEMLESLATELDPRSLITLQEFAGLCGLSYSTLRKLNRKPSPVELPVGQRPAKYRPADLWDWIEREHGSTPIARP